MKKILVTTLLLVTVGITNAAMADTKIAVVDVQAVVSKSAQVQALKKEQQTKMQELEKWLTTAREDVEKQQTQESKEKLLKKYNADFAKKKETIAKNYQTKLQEIDKSITATIASQAKLKGYDMVITKGTVLYGGDDITQDIMKVVK
ncbi:MAG: OmpH family outer membrane protein [Candidatus Gastranaerophilales bacterium]|nr:OmpH family outer membrane protein [Candidatus Gastranaerophilales bacterium]